MPNYNKINLKPFNKDQWRQMRVNYIGGSDASVVLGMNPYASVYELFGEKIGEKPVSGFVNDRMIIGSFFEDTIRRLYQYWVENDPDATESNAESDNRIRRVYKPNFMFVSKKYPFMSANVDGIITDDGKHKDNGLLEVKTMNESVFRQYDGEIPPQYYIQLQHYLSVTGLKWGHFAVIVGMSSMHIYEFERDEEVINNMITLENDFWSKVTVAKELIAEGRHNEIVYPEIDESLATEKYLNEKFEQEQDVVIKGDSKHYEIARNYSKTNSQIKELTAGKRLFSNQLKEYIGSNNGNVLDFGVNGKVSWKTSKKGSRILRVTIK